MTHCSFITVCVYCFEHAALEFFLIEITTNILMPNIIGRQHKHSFSQDSYFLNLCYSYEYNCCKAGAHTLGGMYTESALKRVALSMDLRNMALEKLYPNYVDRFVYVVNIIYECIFSISDSLTSRAPGEGHRAGWWGPTAVLGAERIGVSFTFFCIYKYFNIFHIFSIFKI